MPNNLRNVNVYPIACPAAYAAVLSWETDRPGLVQMAVKGGLSKTCKVKLQDSELGVTFADVSGSELTVKVLGEAGVTKSCKKFVKLLAEGGDQVEVELRFNGGTPHHIIPV
jgi:hypothetical protein